MARNPWRCSARISASKPVASAHHAVNEDDRRSLGSHRDPLLRKWCTRCRDCTARRRAQPGDASRGDPLQAGSSIAGVHRAVAFGRRRSGRLAVPAYLASPYVCVRRFSVERRAPSGAVCAGSNPAEGALPPRSGRHRDPPRGRVGHAPRSAAEPPRIPPTAVVKRAVALRSRLRRVADAMVPPQGIAAERTFLLAEIKMLGVVCELEIPEAIDGGATTADAIADRVGARADATERVLRFLASRGWFVRTARRPLRAQRSVAGPTARRPRVAAGLGALHGGRLALGHLEPGDPPGPRRRVGGDRRARQAVLRLGPRRPARRRRHVRRGHAVAVVGGRAAGRRRRSISTAWAASATSAAAPVACCVPCSMPRRRHEAPCSTSPTSCRGRRRCSAICPPTGGAPSPAASSTAAPIPDGHDRYVMQAIMHDWGDEQAGVILRNVRAAMAPDSRLWVVDSVLDPDERDDLSKAVDMLMLTLTEGGRERTQDEWERLFAANGFRIESQTQLPLLIWVFTLAPVSSSRTHERRPGRAQAGQRVTARRDARRWEVLELGDQRAAGGVAADRARRGGRRRLAERRARRAAGARPWRWPPARPCASRCRPAPRAVTRAALSAWSRPWWSTTQRHVGGQRPDHGAVAAVGHDGGGRPQHLGVRAPPARRARWPAR